MFFGIRELEVRSKEFEAAYQPGEIDFLDATLKQEGPLTASGKVELLSHTEGEVRVRGHITVTINGECDRCLEAAPMRVDSDFDLFYRPAGTGPAQEERAIDEGEAELAFYEGDGIELEEVLREYVLLALPMRHMCREDCQGICPVCGGNRNLAACGCEPRMADDRWAALKQFR